MKVENIVRKLACSPHEFIEIYQEGKAFARAENSQGDDITKLQEEWQDGKERVIKFVSDAYAPENILKIIGCKAQQLKEQQELRITEDGIKIHTFYLPDMVPESFRVETFWNITKEVLSSEESDTSASIVDISIHSESGSDINQLPTTETFVAKSVAASIIQYLDIVDSYFAKFRAKMKQLLDPRNFIPMNFCFGGKSEMSEIEKSDAEGVVSDDEDEQAERVQTIINELKQTKNRLFRESQRILQMEIEFSEKGFHTLPALSRPDTPPPTRTLNQVTCELWRTRQTNNLPHDNPSSDSFSPLSFSSTPPSFSSIPSFSSSSSSSSSLPLPLSAERMDELRMIQTCESNLRNLQAQRRMTDLEIDRTLTELECKWAKQTLPKKEGTLAQVFQCAKYILPLSLLVFAVLHKKKIV